MKENRSTTQDINHCPLCNCDEFLISDSGSLLCASCGSFFENVHQIVAMEVFTPTTVSQISLTRSMLSH